MKHVYSIAGRIRRNLVHPLQDTKCQQCTAETTPCLPGSLFFVKHAENCTGHRRTVS